MKVGVMPKRDFYLLSKGQGMRKELQGGNMGYSKAKEKSVLSKWTGCAIWIFVLLLCAVGLVVTLCWLLGNSEDLTAESADEGERASLRTVLDTPSPNPVPSRKGDHPVQTVVVEDSPVDLPLIDLKNWYAIRYDFNITRVKKERLFNNLVFSAMPAKSLTTHIHALNDYLATEYTLFYWVPYPDGITCSIRDVRDFSDFIQLDLEIKDQTIRKRVENYYASQAHVSERTVFHEFSSAYFSIVFSREHPQYAEMSDLNKGDFVTSKDWGNLFVINTALKGSPTRVSANSMREKSTLFDVNFGILKAVQAKSRRIRNAMSK